MTLLDAARELARARERYAYLLDAAPQTNDEVARIAHEKVAAYHAELDALDALDAAYRIEEYGEVVK